MAGAAFVAKNTTAGKAATTTQIQLLAATVRAKVRGFHVGNTAATAAQGVRFVLDRETTAGTASPITAADTKLLRGVTPPHRPNRCMIFPFEAIVGRRQDRR
jgi:hypothetical protein